MAHEKTKQNNKNLKWLLILPLIMVVSGLVYFKYQILKYAAYGFQPPEMAAAQYTPKDVIGDLGGLKVKIPRHYAEYVEYNGDPGWGEKRKGPVPERTFDSKLRSFGMKVRFPDMVGLENWDLRKEYEAHFLDPENPWIKIGVDVGEDYPGLGADARNALAEGIREDNTFWLYNYERVNEDLYGLEMYVVKGLDPKTGQLARESSNTKDVYIQREASGHVNTFIRCGRPSVPTGVGTCDLMFGLEPDAQVAVDVSFRPSLLPKWKEIQQSVRDLLLSFDINRQDEKADAH